MSITARSITSKARKTLSQHLELVKGDGYAYWIYDDGKAYETRSVYVNSLSSLSVERWIDEARDLVAEMG